MLYCRVNAEFQISQVMAMNPSKDMRFLDNFFLICFVHTFKHLILYEESRKISYKCFMC